MKRTKYKKHYYRGDGTRVKAHSQSYTYRDFAKMRLKKIIDQQKGKKNVMIAMKQMGKEWKTAKTLAPAEIKKNYGSGDSYDNLIKKINRG